MPTDPTRRPGVGPGWPRRTLDVAVSLAALLLLLPVFALVALAVRCSGAGPVLFRQVRLGQGGVPFVIYKFRTMRPGAGGPEVTPADDLRVTGVGQLLRASGLDELPQLLNILRGEMTLVGPRPETPALARRYPDDCKVVFDHRPALTGPSQVRLRDKDVLPVGQALDHEALYLRELVPLRTALDMEYLADPSLRRTFGLLAETVGYLLVPVRRALGRPRPRWRAGVPARPAPVEARVVDLRDPEVRVRDRHRDRSG